MRVCRYILRLECIFVAFICSNKNRLGGKEWAADINNDALLSGTGSFKLKSQSCLKTWFSLAHQH